MQEDKRKVLILDDQEGPQFFYSDEICDLIDLPERIIKCRSVEEVEREISRANVGEIEIAAVLADIEILDREADSLPGKDHGLIAAKMLIGHILSNRGKVGDTVEVFNYVICSRYLETSEVYSAVQKLESNLNVWLPNKLERPVGLEIFRETVGEVFRKVGIAKK